MDNKNLNKEVPVKEGDTISLKCISIGKKGDGIFKHEGFIIVASNTQVNKTYNLLLTRVLPTIGFADVIEDDEDGNDL